MITAFQDPEMVTGFELELPGIDFRPPVTLLASEAAELATVLDMILENEGDARADLTELHDWRDRLVHLYETRNSEGGTGTRGH
jgi:hypothetical protein